MGRLHGQSTVMTRQRLLSLAPLALVGCLIALWIGFAVWVVHSAPFASGTDESINYVAFAAAKNRWATEQDFHRWGIDYFYYPPLYFLLFAPWYGDDPALTEGFPRGPRESANYVNQSGRTMVAAEYLQKVPPLLLRLYRQAKMFSLACGVLVLLSLAATLALLFPGPDRWWIVLLGMTPLVFLPQFLYYQTLCNNDPLVNALGGLAVLFFTAALLFLRERRGRPFLLFSLGTALWVGLSLLTKLTGLVLLLLPVGLAAGLFLSLGGEQTAIRLKKALKLFSVLLVVTVISGGWWILFQAAKGDWNGYHAHRLAHPWAFGSHHLLDLPWLGEQLIGVVRSYFGLFAGMMYDLPDRIIALYLLLPGLCLIASLGLGLKRLRRGAWRWPSTIEGRLQVWLWTVLGGLVVLNLAMLVGNLSTAVLASYGRLMFPTLVASHAIFTLAVTRALGGRRRTIILVTLSLAILCGALFRWVFINRLSPAVRQPAEDVRVLSSEPGSGDGWPVFGPLWMFHIDQPVRLPPGDLIGVRIHVTRKNMLPQCGATLAGKLHLRSPDGQWLMVPCQSFALGDNGIGFRWLELRLSREVRLANPTTAVLSLDATPPSQFSPQVVFNYVSTRSGTFRDVGESSWNGIPSGVSLCLAAVYRTGER